MTYYTRVPGFSGIGRAREGTRPLCFMLRRSSLVECVSVLHGTCLQCVEKKIIHPSVCAAMFVKNPKYTFYTIKSSLTLAYYDINQVQ